MFELCPMTHKCKGFKEVEALLGFGEGTEEKSHIGKWVRDWEEISLLPASASRASAST